MKVSTALTLALGGSIALSQGLIYTATQVFTDPMAMFAGYTTVAPLISFAIVAVVVGRNKQKANSPAVAMPQA